MVLAFRTGIPGSNPIQILYFCHAFIYFFLCYRLCSQDIENLVPNQWLVLRVSPRILASKIVPTSGLVDCLNDCMAFKAFISSISVLLRQPVHLSMPSWGSLKPVFRTMFLPRHWLLSHIAVVKTMDSSEMNPVAMTIINPRKEYWPNTGSNQ